MTEVGWASGPSDRDPAGVNDANQQARYLRHAVPLLWQAGAEMVFWYTLKDEAHNPYGLIAWGQGSDDLQATKPAWLAWQHLIPPPQPATHIPVTSFEDFAGVWIRGDEPYGYFVQNNAMVAAGAHSMALSYAFPRHQNRYVVFRRRRPLPIPRHTNLLCMQVYGDNSAHRLKIWLKDQRGGVIQLVLGPVGASHWHERCVRIPAYVDPSARIWQSDGTVQPPLTLEAIVLDDNPDGVGGQGVVYIDDIWATQISPP